VVVEALLLMGAREGSLVGARVMVRCLRTMVARMMALRVVAVRMVAIRVLAKAQLEVRIPMVAARVAMMLVLGLVVAEM